MNNQFSSYFLNILYFNAPDACAQIAGSPDYPDIFGSVLFFQTSEGTIILTQLVGLPCTKDPCSSRFLGFHIHEGTECSGNSEDPFANAGSHLNPYHCEHPNHMGDLPPILVNDGIAWSVFFTCHIKVCDILNRTLIVHSMPDDFTSQPSGNSGKKIACGTIRSTSESTDSVWP